jgi:hypothetical protein
MSNSEIACPECKAINSLRHMVQELRVSVGEKTVKALQHLSKCSACGFHQISAGDAELLQMRAALTVLRECAPTPAVLRFARKVLGLKQSDIPSLLGYAAETVSRIETGSAPAPAAYAPALGGLLDRAIVRRLGGDPDFVVERASPEEQRISQTG